MNKLQQLIEKVEHVAATRPSYSIREFLPKQVLELGVLEVLVNGDLSGDLIIRELALLSRYARNYGVKYPLLHEMEAAGYIEAYRQDNSPRRIYRITGQGREHLHTLRQFYHSAGIEQYQTGLQLVYGLTVVSSVATYAN